MEKMQKHPSVHARTHKAITSNWQLAAKRNTRTKLHASICFNRSIRASKEDGYSRGRACSNEKPRKGKRYMREIAPSNAEKNAGVSKSTTVHTTSAGIRDETCGSISDVTLYAGCKRAAKHFNFRWKRRTFSKCFANRAEVAPHSQLA